MKFSVNSLCPCGSKKKYKKCCKIFHNGALPNRALELMKSRYCAYALGNSKYIMNTTHPTNNDFNLDFKSWEENIINFMNDTTFNTLQILDYIQGDKESFVTFKANMHMHENDSSFTEKSRFLNENGKWLYVSGDFNQDKTK